MPTNNDDNKSRERAANEAANSDEQAANVRSERAANGCEPFAAQWLTVAEVADLLGVTPRTIQKRCKAGKLDACTVETPTGDQWQINAANVETKRTEAAHRATNRATKGREQAANVRREQAAKGDEQAANCSQPQDAAPPYWKERETELKEQVQWLRNSNEQHQRDAIELRQLLKRALDLAPKQLTAGAAPEPQEREEIAGAPNDSHADANDVQETAKRDGAPLTYNDIADQLERRLNQR